MQQLGYALLELQGRATGRQQSVDDVEADPMTPEPNIYREAQTMLRLGQLFRFIFATFLTVVSVGTSGVRIWDLRRVEGV